MYKTSKGSLVLIHAIKTIGEDGERTFISKEQADRAVEVVRRNAETMVGNLQHELELSHDAWKKRNEDCRAAAQRERDLRFEIGELKRVIRAADDMRDAVPKGFGGKTIPAAERYDATRKKLGDV